MSADSVLLQTRTTVATENGQQWLHAVFTSVVAHQVAQKSRPQPLLLCRWCRSEEVQPRWRCLAGSKGTGGVMYVLVGETHGILLMRSDQQIRSAQPPSSTSGHYVN